MIALYWHLLQKTENEEWKIQCALQLKTEMLLKWIDTYDCSDAFHFVDPPYINSDCGHYEGSFNEQNMEDLLKLLEKVKGKFMLTMFPLNMIEDYANKNGWKIHRIKRTISASKVSRRKQEEWIVCNYEVGNKQITLF